MWHKDFIYTDFNNDISLDLERDRLNADCGGVIYRFDDLHDWTSLKKMGRRFSDVLKSYDSSCNGNTWSINSHGYLISDHFHPDNDRTTYLYMYLPDERYEIDFITGEIKPSENSLVSLIDKGKATAAQIKASMKSFGAAIRKENSKPMAAIWRNDREFFLTVDEIKRVHDIYEESLEQDRCTACLKRVLTREGIRDERAEDIAEAFISSGDMNECIHKKEINEKEYSDDEEDRWNDRFLTPVIENYVIDRHITPDEKDMEWQKEKETEFNDSGANPAMKPYVLPWCHCLRVYAQGNGLFVTDEKDGVCATLSMDDMEKIKDIVAVGRLKNVIITEKFTDLPEGAVYLCEAGDIDMFTPDYIDRINAGIRRALTLADAVYTDPDIGEERT